MKRSKKIMIKRTKLMLFFNDIYVGMDYCWYCPDFQLHLSISDDNRYRAAFTANQSKWGLKVGYYPLHCRVLPKTFFQSRLLSNDALRRLD